MKVCNIMPDIQTCLACSDTQITYNRVEDCGKCPFKSEDYELLTICVSLFGTPYAIVQLHGKPEKVRLSRVYNIREAQNECRRKS